MEISPRAAPCKCIFIEKLAFLLVYGWSNGAVATVLLNSKLSSEQTSNINKTKICT